MAIKINQKITGYNVVKAQEPAAETAAAPVLQQMNEELERPEVLIGSTYKIKSPMSEHALYITINDVVLNQGTEHEQRRPFEIFINSKNMEQFQWIVAFTRVASAVFRKGGDCSFLADELKSVFDPQGGYFKKGGKFMPSLVAEIGHVIERHLKSIGMIEAEAMDDSQRAFLEQKRAEFEGKAQPDPGIAEALFEGEPESKYPASATLCKKCHTKAVIQIDGCDTCLNCGESKCS